MSSKGEQVQHKVMSSTVFIQRLCNAVIREVIKDLREEFATKNEGADGKHNSSSHSCDRRMRLSHINRSRQDGLESLIHAAMAPLDMSLLCSF